MEKCQEKYVKVGRTILVVTVYLQGNLTAPVKRMPDLADVRFLEQLALKHNY